MINIQEMEARIAAELEEAGQENIAAMINTIITPSGDAAEIAMLRVCLDNMVRVASSRWRWTWAQEKDWRSFLLMRSLAIHCQDRAAAPISNQRLSLDICDKRAPQYSRDAGWQRCKVSSILEERGYRWWRPER